MRDSWKSCPIRKEKEEDRFPLKRSDADRKGEMKILMVRWRSGGRGSRLSCFAWRSPARRLGCALLTVSLAGIAFAQGTSVVVERNGRVISLVPYAPNILRVTMSNDKTTATGAAGYGFVATPSTEGWTNEQ